MGVEELSRHILAVPAILFSVNKFYNDLKSQGVACSKNTLHEYLDYLMDAYLVYTVTLHSRSERVRSVNLKKVYAIDTGLANASLHQPQTNWGRLLENFVFMELSRKELHIDHYRTANSLIHVDCVDRGLANRDTHDLLNGAVDPCEDPNFLVNYAMLRT